MVSCAYIRMVNIKRYISKCEQWWMMTSMVVSENGLSQNPPKWVIVLPFQ